MNHEFGIGRFLLQAFAVASWDSFHRRGKAHDKKHVRPTKKYADGRQKKGKKK